MSNSRLRSPIPCLLPLARRSSAPLRRGLPRAPDQKTVRRVSKLHLIWRCVVPPVPQSPGQIAAEGERPYCHEQKPKSCADAYRLKPGGRRRERRHGSKPDSGSEIQQYQTRRQSRDSASDDCAPLNVTLCSDLRRSTTLSMSAMTKILFV